MAPSQPPLFSPYKKLHCIENGLAAKPPQFTLFPKLPPELQLMIWEHAASEPHILQLNLAKRHGRQTELGGFVTESLEMKCIYNQQSPLLTACRASRCAFLRVPGTVQSAFGLGAPLKGGRGVLWRPNMDLVVLDRSFTRGDLDLIMGSEVIRHLAVHYDLARELFSESSSPFQTEKGRRQWWRRLGFRNLRTWEIYAPWIVSSGPLANASKATRDFMGILGGTHHFFAGWIDRLDALQAVNGLRRNGPHIVWVPPRQDQSCAYKKLFGLFERVRGGPEQLLGRPIFGV
ncbi:hypothetical protein PG985_013970 [Apiospora marii]|uniref:2EXR domain-containing protein n=1 Tax=Apiospora marii TaxID=335849 RepID=A0ABR1R698_9PEZI